MNKQLLLTATIEALLMCADNYHSEGWDNQRELQLIEELQKWRSELDKEEGA